MFESNVSTFFGVVYWTVLFYIPFFLAEKFAVEKFFMIVGMDRLVYSGSYMDASRLEFISLLVPYHIWHYFLLLLHDGLPIVCLPNVTQRWSLRTDQHKI